MRFDPKQLTLTKHIFFSGKGGAGKTSAASAAAISIAEAGRRVLIVSTDPASNLEDVFGMKISASAPTRIAAVDNLYALNIDPKQAAGSYREKIVEPYRDKLPEAAVVNLEEQLSGACTVEIAAFDEFTGLLVQPDVNNSYDHIIFDTAPTGHTLRLLQLPSAWSDFLHTSTHGASCLGPLSGLQEKEDMYQEAVRTLTDESSTTFYLVARPQQSSLEEADRASRELKELGIYQQSLIINGIHPEKESRDETADFFIQGQQQALSRMSENLRLLPQYTIALLAAAAEGIDGLRRLLSDTDLKPQDKKSDLTIPELPGLDAFINTQIEKGSGLIMTMGKGGVGKTTIAAAIARRLANAGHSVHLTTTDPANHLPGTLAGESLPETITVSSIHPPTEKEHYKQSVLTKVASDLDEDSLAYIKEDLDSPCTEEIAVFYAFARLASRAEKEFVVLDTAPTGHTLLLLDAAESYHQEVLRSAGELPEEVKQLLPLLHDPQKTAVVLATLPEATPVLEAERLQDDLKRAGIQPSWWVINHSFLSAGTMDPVLLGRAFQEKRWISRVAEQQAGQVSLLPFSIHSSVKLSQH
ncbi:arsenical pump-driving ATPase [Alteribacillus sp. HJP-4]|uniref:arsenical pump-driving ATPase n=1 Tax=Alteribacillus sp. HJP-4 TaxID=2775394 RepID=UPI0035CD2B1F